MVGGSLGFSYTTDHADYVNTATFSFAPLIGGFVAKNFVLGVSPLIMYQSSSGTAPDSFHTHIYNSVLSAGIGPYARYYIRIGPQIYLFIHGSPSIMGTWTRNSDAPNTPVLRTTAANWMIGPGLSFMVSKTVAVEASLYYNGNWHRSSYFVNGNQLGNAGTAYIDNGMVFNVGFQVYLERNKKEQQANTSK